ncbi:DNA polymerase ligase N-terminal domain-containing protein [Coxiella-like endosymbiont]
MEYADFEGNITKGHYEVGGVIVWDRETWKPEKILVKV